jgi:hypothetical protein
MATGYRATRRAQRVTKPLESFSLCSRSRAVYRGSNWTVPYAHAPSANGSSNFDDRRFETNDGINLSVAHATLAQTSDVVLAIPKSRKQTFARYRVPWMQPG